MAKIKASEKKRIKNKVDKLQEIDVADKFVESFVNNTGDFSKIVRIRPPTQQHKIIFPIGMLPDIYPDYYETFEYNSAGSDSQIFTLEHNIEDYFTAVSQTGTPGTDNTYTGDQLLVVYDNDTDGGGTREQVLVDDIDFENNQFSYQPNNTGVTRNLDVYYPPLLNAKIQMRHYKPNSRQHLPVYKSRIKDQLLIPRFEQKTSKIKRIAFGKEVKIVGEQYVDIVIKSDVEFSNWDDKDAYPNFELLGIVEEATEQELREQYT